MESLCLARVPRRLTGGVNTCVIPRGRCGEEHVLNHDAIPAACFTHPEIAMVGPTEEQARERANADGYEIGVSQGSFKANSKALAEGAGDGIAKVARRGPSNTPQALLILKVLTAAACPALLRLAAHR